MECKGKIKLSKHGYIALFEDFFVLVTLDDNGKPVRWAIFGKDEKPV